MVICMEWRENNLHLFQWCHCYAVISCFVKIRNGSAFLIPRYQGCPRKEMLLVLNSLHELMQYDNLNIFAVKSETLLCKDVKWDFIADRLWHILRSWSMSWACSAVGRRPHPAAWRRQSKCWEVCNATSTFSKYLTPLCSSCTPPFNTTLSSSNRYATLLDDHLCQEIIITVIYAVFEWHVIGAFANASSPYEVRHNMKRTVLTTVIKWLKFVEFATTGAK